MSRLAAILLVTALLAACIAAHAATLQCTVVDPDGRPVPNAKVLIQGPTQRDAAAGELDVETIFRGYTDVDGKVTCSVEDKPELEYCRIVAVADHWSFGSATWRGEKAEETSRIVLYPERRIEGQVVDEDGNPLAGTKVELRQYQAFERGGGINSFSMSRGAAPGQTESISDENGRFVVLHLPDLSRFDYGHAQLQLSAEGRALVDKQLQKEDIDHELVIAQPLACALDGTLLLPDRSAPAPEGTRLEICVDTHMSRFVSTDAEGNFRLDDLPPGKATIMLADPGARPGAEPAKWVLPQATDIDIAPGRPATLELALQQGALVKGKVVISESEDRITRAAARIQHEGRPGMRHQQYVSAAENGEFAVRVAAGPVTVFVQQIATDKNQYHFYGENAVSESFTVADGQEITDLEVEVTRAQLLAVGSSLSHKPIPDDFELTPGTYQLTWDPDIPRGRGSLYSFDRLWGAAEQAVSGIAAKPRFASDKPRITAMRIDGEDVDGYVVVAFDESKGTGTGYDTVYVDANRNSDLSDDEPHALTEKDSYQRSADWILVSSHQGPAGAVRTDNPIKVSPLLYSSGDNIYFQVRMAGAWGGKIESSSGEIECASVDSDSDGIYGEQAQIADEERLYLTMGDSFHADTNGAGSVFVEEYGGRHRIPLQKVCKVGRKFCSIQVDPVGNQVTIDPYEGAVGRLLVRVGEIEGNAAELSYLSVSGEPGEYRIGSAASEPIDLPVGKYGINGCNLRLGEAETRLSNVYGSLDEIVQIEPGETRTLGIGGDLSMAINPGTKDLYLVPDDTFRMNWTIKIGDQMAVSRVGDYQTSPVVKFFDRKGKMRHKTDASYT